MNLRRVGILLLGVALLSALFGCDLFQASPPVSLVAWASPSTGKVPYSATIVCTAPPGQYTFKLPNETVGPQAANTLEVVVDSLNWKAIVSWTDGVNVQTYTVNATGNNPRPNIHGIRINGKNDLWVLKPMERTLIEVIVYYENEWRVSSFVVEGSNSSAPFTVFYPPYEAGVCHAYWYSWIIENACIVYPVYASVDTAGLPYSPTGLDEGYPTSYQPTNQFFYDYGSSTEHELEIPAQEGTVSVTVEDEFGRLTTQTFSIPVSAMDFTDMPDDPPDDE
jgi:hypothetical protein